MKATTRRNTDPKDRFASKYLVDEDTGCWLWTACTNGNGSPMININGKSVMAHRYAYEAFRGPIPPDTTVARTCPSTMCVNSDHLTLVSTNPVDRFWSNVNKTDDHWLWLRSAFIHGVDGQSVSPRHYAWNLLQDHQTTEYLFSLCGESRCVKPQHAGTAQDRFWTQVDKNADGCWYWLGAKLAGGYPHLEFEGVSVYAHRLSYEWAGGTLQEGCVLRHTCGHTSCVRPAHLEQITYVEMVELREERRESVECGECGDVFRNLKGHERMHVDA